MKKRKKVKKKKRRRNKLAFGISRKELLAWKQQIENGYIAFLTHYWIDNRFPNVRTVTKVGCSDLNKLALWGAQYGLKRERIHHRRDGYSHFDLLAEQQKYILSKEGLLHQLHRFK